MYLEKTLFSEPHTEILGGDDMHVDWGSTINLTCVSKFNPAPPVDVIWYHNDKVNIKVQPYFELKNKKLNNNSVKCLVY